MTQQTKTEAGSLHDQAETKPHIKIEEQGPYVVTGGIKLVRRIRVLNSEGEAVEWKAGDDYPPQSTPCRLCRCGNSKTKPFCDDSHLEVEWDGELTADRAPGETRRQLFQGSGVIMTDDNSLCAGFAFCDPYGGVWDEIEQTDDPAVRARLEHQISLCPSGRLQYTLKRNGEPVEVKYEPMIATIHNGPYWVLGGIPVETPDGFAYEVRNRQLLCRCGQSQNKPFCDGTHWNIKFKAP